jgi:hypothetical protein
VHGQWWRFDPKTSTIKVRGERKRQPEWADYTEADILTIDSTRSAPPLSAEMRGDADLTIAYASADQFHVVRFVMAAYWSPR